ncbi:thiamine biosynthesis protein ThiS [Paenibacillus sp. BIHB 4019]|uniref:Thiamine biosynthesis protein ThiS n=1 Tax=Paenibacillus sp. BIHB 4019 TaxID=1870819 RepID=A0A1B2DCW3_9BACL|nr:sulfur carrier protein ThiS [Paenibacillus sp. BIHB 4019]ANY65548.1 thiamine biosynthesis protein ThiS [Paenibacillus sp. BIHB 4019]
MELVINGVKQELAARTIEEVIAHFELTGKPVVVEADGAVLTQEQWAATEVREGMKIELVHFVGGG